MLREVLKKLMVEKHQSNSDKETGDGEIKTSDAMPRSRSLATVDDTEVIRRRKRPGAGIAEKNKQRLRVVSCPDETYLHKLCCDSNFKMLDLRRIREESDVNQADNCNENNASIILSLENSRLYIHGIGIPFKFFLMSSFRIKVLFFS